MLHPRAVGLLPLVCFVCLQGACQPAGVSVSDHGEQPRYADPNNPNQAAPPASTPEPANAAGPVTAGVVGGPGGHYTLVGRFDATLPDQLRFSFPNSKLGARFVGTEVAVWLSDDGDDTYDVAIDSDPQVIISPAAVSDGSKQRIVLATGLANRSHTVWLRKRTEGNATANDNSGQRTGAAVFYGFDVGAGHFLPAPGTQKYLIEAVGDSAFTGYGAMANIPSGGQTCVFVPASENADYSTPARLAEALGAEVINVSAAGKGVASSVYSTDPNAQLPNVYLRTVQPDDSPAWTFNEPTVAAVVVQAGANDLAGSFGSGYFVSRSRFVAAYTDLLATIRSHRPTAPIVCVVTAAATGSDPATLRDAYKDAIAARQADGDSNLSTYSYFDDDPNNYSWYGDASAALGLGSGCEGHPSEQGGRFLAGRLAAYLRTVASFD